MANKSFMSSISDAITNTPEYRTAAETAQQIQSGISQATSSVESAVKSVTDSIKYPINNQTPAETARLNRPAPTPETGEDETKYSHDSENTSSGATDLNLNLQIQPNILDNYDVVTYHWKLFITDPGSSSTGKIFDLKNQYIIVETGVTDLTIDKVEIVSLATPSKETGTGTSTNVKFTVTEPSGAGMIDKLFYQSIALGIGNWNTIPFYLQLQFKNRSPETSEPDDGVAGSLASQLWLYTLKITSISANVTQVGTVYDFTAITYNEFAQSNAISTMQYNTVLSNLDTFETAMAELATKLNNDQLQNILSSSYSIPDTFKIVVDPLIAGYKITPGNSSTNSRRNDDYVSWGNKTATYAANTAIDKIIDSLLSNTDEYQKALTPADVPGASGATDPEKASHIRQFWRIVTETRPLEFDILRKDVAKEFTIFVVAYEIGIMTANAVQEPLTPELERARLATLFKKRILKKQYNYIFTGLNDQILKFDVRINNAFMAATSRFAGIYDNAGMSDKGVVNHDHSADEEKVTSAISKAIGLYNNASTAGTAAAQQAFIDATRITDSANISEADRELKKRILAAAKPENRAAFLNEARAKGGVSGVGLYANKSLTSVNLATPSTNYATGDKLNFISSVDVNSPSAKKVYADLMESSKNKLRPVAKIVAGQDRQVGLGLISNSNSGLQKLSSMFSTALNSGLDASFAILDMTIKGDPFWLFPPPITDKNAKIYNTLKPKAEAIDWIKKLHLKYVNSVNYFGTDNFLFVRFRTPRVYDSSEDPDSTDATVDVQTFSGVYRVNSVTSKFYNGKFEQALLGTLDHEIMMFNVMDQINNASSKPSTPAVPVTDVSTNAVLPDTAIKQPRILGSVADTISNTQARAKGVIGGTYDKLLASLPTSVRNFPISNLPPDTGA